MHINIEITIKVVRNWLPFLFTFGVLNHATTAHILLTTTETKDIILFQIFNELVYQ